MPYFPKRLLILVLLSFCIPLRADLDDYLPLDPGPTSSIYGETGLFEVPTARMMPEGSLKFGLNSSFPYEMTVLSATPFSWLEATYRYTEIKNELYSPFPSFSGNQTFKDKAFDFKFKIIEESRYLPSIAVGLRDVGGTGWFSSEYITGSKSYGPFDLTLGLGWGQLARTADLSNPLTSIGDSFLYRPGYGGGEGGEGGTLNYDSWFSGRDIGLFGGLEYRIKRFGARFKIEYDTSNQKNPAPPLRPIEVKSRINLGLAFPMGRWGEFSVGYQRGNVLQFSVFFKGEYSKTLVPKTYDPPPALAKLNPKQKQLLLDKDLFYSNLLRNLNRHELYLQGATLKDNKVEVTTNNGKYRSYARATGRAARVVASLSPEEVEEIEINHFNGNSIVVSVKLPKEKFLKAVNNEISHEELLIYSEIQSPNSDKLKSHEFRPKPELPSLIWKMAPALRTHIGGPEAFFLGQLWWKTDFVLMLTRGLSLYTTLGVNIYDNFDELNNPSASELPHVRSDIQSYLKEGKTNIARMKFEYIFNPMNDVYARFDAGLMEEMFGGVGGEVLYRPYGSKWALGLVAHKVRQRDYDQRFNFRKYEVTTGHLEFYYQFPKGITSQVYVGKYLGGDKGLTVDLSRRFQTGFTLGIFASKTNISSEEFGEGSFDKGFYFAVPTDMFLPRYQPGLISFALHPLTKDGAAMIFNHNALWGMLGDTEDFAIKREWRNLLD
tara:strand:- start:1253 stop:3406 length:2154 start_codon:yes stop_codon:yes gene_type:complete